MEGPIDYDTRLGISKREWTKVLGANLALLLTAYVVALVCTLPIDGIVRVDRGETGVFTLVNDGVAITVSNVALSFLRIF